MKPKLKLSFLIFVVLVSFVVISEYVSAGACQGSGDPDCSEYNRATCFSTSSCLWDQDIKRCESLPCSTWDYNHATCSTVNGNGCGWVGECIPDASSACGSNQGECQKGTQICSEGGWWGPCREDIKPRPEVCDEDKNDEDCDSDDNKRCGTYSGDGSNAAGMCYLKTECGDDEHFIMSISGDDNAHASLNIGYYYDSPNKNAICCNVSYFESIDIGDGCAVKPEEAIVSLSNYDNAHVSHLPFSYGGYSNNVCFESGLSGVEIDCDITTLNQKCEQMDGGDSRFCVFSLSSDEGNAHVGKCGDSAFEYKVCCSITPKYDDMQECDADEECKPGTDGKGHCVQYNSLGTTVCRTTDPACGDDFCYTEYSTIFGDIIYNKSDDCPGATREDDLTNCQDDPVCGYYQCSGVCDLRFLPAGEYPSTFEEPVTSHPYLVTEKEYPTTPTDACNKDTFNDEEGFGMHCDGAGNCVTSCIDDDDDGYGIQPDPAGLYDAESCWMGSDELDCNDDGSLYNKSYPFLVNPGSLSPFCDCDLSTPDLDWLEGIQSGMDEGPINIQIPIEQDLCFDEIDNDCDSKDGISNVDCLDVDCSPEEYIFPIRNRTCGINDKGESDCKKDDKLKINYQTEPKFDRACCPNLLDCVINGECVASGDLHGEFPNVHQCIRGQWYGSDVHFSVCDVIVNDTNYDPLDYSHWGLTGNAGNGACCGDDLNEYYTPGEYGSYACCDKPDMQVIGGKCVGSLTEVHTWDKTSGGYCLDDTQCLVNPNEVDFDKTVDDATSIYYSRNKVRCINNGEFIGDHYCRNGEWTSRTALLIRQLMDIAGGSTDYSLFCDSYDNVLNFYGYAINEWYPAVNYLQTGEFQCKIGKGEVVNCVNNICVLQYEGNRVVIGASINHDVDASSYSVLEALGGTNRECSNVLDSNAFEVCGEGVYYNNKIKSILYSRNELTISDVLTGGEAAYIRNLFEPTLYYLQYTPPSYDYSFVNETHDFNKIFISKKGDKTIYIITEEVKNKKYMSATYSNFDTDICAMTDNYKLNNPVLVPFDCVKQGNVFYVFTGGLTKGYYDLLNDLGPKLRIR